MRPAFFLGHPCRVISSLKAGGVPRHNLAGAGNKMEGRAVIILKKSAFLLSLMLVLLTFAMLLYAPAEAVAGAKRGLAVCAGVIVPSLLPFLILSGLLTGLGLPRLLARPLGPLFGKLFGVSGAAAAPFLLGLTGGYPVGAASAVELVRRGEIDAEEGGCILPFINNTGPAFIIGAAGSGIFGSAALGLMLYLSHILAAVAVGLLFSLGKRRREERKAETDFVFRSLAEILPESVKSAVTATLNICGFVVFFSVLTAMLDRVGLFSGIAGAIAVRTGLELRFCRALLAGILELGSGVSAMSGLTATPLNLALASFVLGFGSLSVHCQTLAAVSGTDIKTARHFAGRLLHGLLSAGITLLLCTFFRT